MTGFELFTGESCSLSQLSLHMQGLLMGFALSLRTEKHTPPSGPDISSIAVFAGNFFSALQNITHTFTHEVSTTSEFAIRYLLALYLFRGDVSLANQAVNGQLPGMISNRCSTVFDKNDVFYRCQDCSSDETVVICAECFDASDHDGHNVTFYTDSTSGCCDCGDVTAWTRLPKCKIHTAAAGTESKNKLTADQSNYMMHAIHALLYFARDILLRHKIPRAHQYHDLTYFPRCKVPHYSQSEHRPSPYENLQRVAYTPPMHPSPNHYTMLYNNDINTFDQVIHFLESNRFIKSSEQGSAIAETIDEIGRAVIHISPVLPKDRLAQLANFAPLQASVTSQTQLQSELVVEILLSSLLQMCQSSACIRNATCRAFAEEYRPVPDSVFDELATITRRFRLLNSYLNTSVFLWKRVRNIILSLLLSTVIISNKRHLVITCMEFVISIPLLMNNLVLIDAETNFNIFYMITQIISCTEMTTLFRCQEWILSTLIPVFKKLPAGSKSRQRFNEMVHRAGDALSTPEAHRNVLDTKSLQIIIDLAGCMISQTVFTRRTTSHVEIENLEWPTVFNSIIHFSQLANAFINCFRSSTPLQRNELLRHIYKQLPMKDYDPLLNPDTGLLDHCISQQGVIVAIPLSWTFSKMVSAKAITSLEPIIAALWPSGDPSIHVQRTIHPPLAIFALSAQFNANLWRRNGSSFTEMLLYYRSSLLQENSSMGDLFLMQLAAAGLMDADVLVRQAAKHFGLLEWLLPGGVPPSRTRALSSGDDGEMSSLPPLLRPRAPPFDLDNTLALIEEFLIFLSALMTDRLAVAQQGDLHTYSDAICKLLLTQSIFSGIKRHSEIMSTLPSDFQSDPRSRALLASITELIPAEPGTAAASNPNAVAGNHCKLRNSWPMLGYFNPSNIHMCRMRRSRSAATVLGMMASLTPGDFVPASLPVPGLRVPGDKLLSTVTPAHYHSLLDARLDFLHEYQIRPALARLPASVAQCRKAQAGLPGLATPRGLQDFACNESLLAIVHSLLATFCVAYDASFARIPPPKRSGDTEALTSPSIIAQLLQLLADALALELVFAETEAGAGRGRRFAGLLTTLALPMSDIDLSESQRFSMPSLLRRYLARGSASQAGPSSPQGDATMANAEAPVIGPPGAGQLASSPATVVDLLAYVHFRLTHRDAPGAGPASASGPAAPADADAGLSQSADYTKLLGYMSWISAALDRLGLGECLTTAYAAVTAANDALLAEAGVGAASDSASSPALSAEEAQRRKEEERKLRWQRILDKQKASVSTFMANHEDLLKDGLFEDEAASAGVSDEEGLQVGPDAGAGPGAEPAAMRPVRDGIHPFFTFSRSNSCAVCREALTPAAPGGYIGLVQHSSLPRRQFAMLDVTAAPSVASSLLDSADMAATGPPTPRSIATAETGHQAACKRIDAHLAARLDPKAPASEQLVDVDLNQPWPVQRSWTPQQSNCFASTFTSPAGSFVSTCGHTIHFGCAAPLKRIQVDIAEPYQFLRCPVCQETSNTVLSLAAGPLIARQLPAVAPFHAWLATASGAGYDQLVDFHVGRTAFTQADLLPGHFAHLTKKHLTQWWTAQQPGHLLALFFEVLSLGPKVAATGPIPGHLLRPVAQDPTRAPGLAAYAQMVTATKAPGGPACRAPPVPAFPVPVVAAALTHQPLSPLVDDGFFFPQAMPDNIQSFRLRNLFPRVLACSVLAHTIRSVEAAQRGCRHPTTGLTLVDADGRAISRSGDITGLFLETIGLRDVLALRTALDTFALAALRTPLSLPALESNALALARMLSVGHHDMTNELDRTTFLRVPALESVLLVCLMNRISELVFSLDLGQQSPAMGEVDPATAALLSRPLPADVFNWIRVFLLREVVKVTLRFVAEHPGQLSPVDAGSEPSFVEWLGPRSASVAAGAPSPGTVAGRALLAQDNAAVLGDLAGLISRVALGQDFAMGPGLSAKLLRLVRAYTLPLLRQFALLVFALLGVPVPVPDDSGDHPAAMSEWDLLARYLELPFDLRSLFDGGPGAGAGAGAGGSTDARCSVAAMEVDHVSAPLSDGVSQAITLSGHLVAAWVTAEATPPGGSAGVMSSDTGGGLSPGPVDAGRWEMMPVRQSPTVSPDPGYLPGRAAVLHLEHPFVYETVYLPQTLDRLLRLAGSPEYHCTSCSKPASSRATFCLLCGEVLCLRPGCRSPPTARFRGSDTRPLASGILGPRPPRATPWPKRSVQHANAEHAAGCLVVCVEQLAILGHNQTLAFHPLAQMTLASLMILAPQRLDDAPLAFSPPGVGPEGRENFFQPPIKIVLTQPFSLVEPRPSGNPEADSQAGIRGRRRPGAEDPTGAGANIGLAMDFFERQLGPLDAQANLLGDLLLESGSDDEDAGNNLLQAHIARFLQQHGQVPMSEDEDDEEDDPATGSDPHEHMFASSGSEDEDGAFSDRSAYMFSGEEDTDDDDDDDDDDDSEEDADEPEQDEEADDREAHGTFMHHEFQSDDGSGSEDSGSGSEEEDTGAGAGLEDRINRGLDQFLSRLSNSFRQGVSPGHEDGDGAGDGDSDATAAQGGSRSPPQDDRSSGSIPEHYILPYQLVSSFLHVGDLSLRAVAQFFRQHREDFTTAFRAADMADMLMASMANSAGPGAAASASTMSMGGAAAGASTASSSTAAMSAGSGATPAGAGPLAIYHEWELREFANLDDTPVSPNNTSTYMFSFSLRLPFVDENGEMASRYSSSKHVVSTKHLAAIRARWLHHRLTHQALSSAGE